MAADPHADTATQRPATGLDEGARRLILQVLAETVGGGPGEVLTALYRDRYGDISDYLGAVDRVWGAGASYGIANSVTAIQREMQFGPTRVSPDIAIPGAVLVHAPEPDFRLAVTERLREGTRGRRRVEAIATIAERITRICRTRGAPWVVSASGEFMYVGDEEVERELIRPALAAINRPEFSDGVKSEFDQARAELVTGTPEALSQAVHKAGCVVESAMKVVLDERGIEYGGGDGTKRLFDRLVAEGIVPHYMENVVLAAMTPRNRSGGHGAGATAHAVDPDAAQAVVASGAGAISYLASRLP
jgi:hypothetical protein